MILVSSLTKRYGARAAIENLSFEIGRGEIVGFLGPNGAGKSTTMKILTGFMPATSGTAKVAGFDVFSRPLDVKRNVGYLPETPPVYMEMTVSDYLAFAGKIHGLSGAPLTRAISQAIDKVVLGDVRHRIIGNLSKGYRQRVGLAQALLHNPKVLILDEPTVGLDPRQIIEIRELIKSLGGDHTVILSSHILPEVTATCDRIVMINKGKIVAQDTLSGLLARYNAASSYALAVRSVSDSAIDAIKALPSVRNVTSSSGRVMVEIDPGGEDIREKISEIAVKQGMGLQEFNTGRVSLEEIYLKLTQSGDAR